MKFQKAITTCGAPLYVFPMPHVDSVAIGVLVHAGTRDERPSEHGIAHALEHMVFQGNERLPSSQAIASEIETIGGNLNAFTSQEMTFYFRVVPDEALHVGVDSLASQLTTSLFREKNIESEMRNVVQEIKRAHDNHVGFCGRLFNKTIFGESALGKDVLGTEQSVLGFCRDDFLKFSHDFYHPENYTFIVIGKTSVQKALSVFNRAFSKTLKDRTKNVRIDDRRIFPRGVHNNVVRDIAQANIYLGTAIDSPSGDERKALEFYTKMIDGGMSFPLFQEVRDKRGLCYAVHAGLDTFTDCEVFEVYVGTEPSRVQEAITCIHEVVAQSCTEELFKRARTYLLGHNKVSLFSDPVAILTQAARDIVLLGEPRSPAEFRRDIEKQTLEGVRGAVERHLLDPNTYSYAYVGPPGTKV
ncbi:MAG: pitrilysin family protein [bacterium]|nr:pitrilysin family protein [bacterium]